MIRPDIAAEVVRRQIDALRTEFPDVFEDEDFAADVIEGQTDLYAILEDLSEQVADNEANVEAVKARIGQLYERKARIERTAGARRALIMRLMDAAGQSKIPLPTATLSLRNGAPKVVVTDESRIPARYTRTKVEVDKAALREALKTGETIDGACLSNGEATLSIRRS